MARTTKSRIAAALAGALVLVCSQGAFAQTSGGEESLYDRLGGLPAISLVLTDFVDAFVADPVIMANPAVRERKTGDAVPHVRYQLITLVCEVTGGPCEYHGASLRDAHAGLNVTEAEWTRMGEIFAETLARHQVPERETQELFAIVAPTKADIVVAAD